MRFLLHRESPWIPVVLIVMLVGCWSEMDLYAPSFPMMLKYFETTNFMMTLTLALNFIGFFIAALLCGPLAEAYGRRPIILGGSLIFALGSLVCVAAPNIEAMLIGRFIQGFGVSAPVTVSMAVVADIYQGDRQIKLMTRMNSAITVVMALAPIIGAQLTQDFGWRSNFIVIFLVAGISCTLLWLLVPETHHEDNRVEFSSKSLFMSYWTLLKSRNFMIAVIGLCLAVTPYFIFIGIAPLLLQEDLGLSLDAYKFYQGSVVAIFAGLSLLLPSILKRFNATTLLWGSVVLSTLALGVSLLLSFIMPDNENVITGLMWLYTMGIVVPPTLMFTEAMEMHPELRACASSLIQSIRMLSMAAGLWLAGTLYDKRYLFAILVMFVFLVASIPFTISVIRRREKEGTKTTSVAAMH